MEFLFWNQLASFEAIIVLLCVALICVIFLYDGYRFIARVLGILTPRKEYVKEKMAEEGKKEEDSLARIEEEVVKISEEELPNEENLSGDAGIQNTSDEIIPEEIISDRESVSSETDEQIEQYLQEESAETIEDIYKEEFDSLPPDIQEEIIEIQEEILEETSIAWNEDISPESIAQEEFSQEDITEVSERIPQTSDDIVEQEEEMEEKIEDTSTEIEEIAPELPIEESVSQETEVPVETPSEETITEEQDKKSEESTIEPLPYVRPSRIHDEVEDAPKKEIPQISPEKRDKLVEITNNTKTLIARGHIPEARALIIEWLSIHKNHRELNIMLGELYERDHGFEKAEFIYKDLAHTYPDDVDILMHLAGTLAMQRKYRISYELYRKVLSIQGETEEILYTLTHLASELSETEDTYEYARSYIKQYPKNPEILWLLSQSQISTGRRKEAIETLIKLKNLTPYSQEIVDLIGKLVTEEEMAGNFGETNV